MAKGHHLKQRTIPFARARWPHSPSPPSPPRHPSRDEDHHRSTSPLTLPTLILSTSATSSSTPITPASASPTSALTAGWNPWTLFASEKPSLIASLLFQFSAGLDSWPAMILMRFRPMASETCLRGRRRSRTGNWWALAVPCRMVVWRLRFMMSWWENLGRLVFFWG